MPHKVGIDNCKREQYLFGGNMKVPCGACQACRDQKMADKIRNEHVAGKFCKQSNNCSICQYIKYLRRLLRHVGGTCNKSKRCEICQYEKKYSAQFIDFKCKRTVVDLYCLMLNKKKYSHLV